MKGTTPVAVKITPHQFNVAADAFYNHPEDRDLNDQGNRRESLRAAFAAVGLYVESD